MIQLFWNTSIFLAGAVSKISETILASSNSDVTSATTKPIVQRKIPTKLYLILSKNILITYWKKNNNVNICNLCKVTFCYRYSFELKNTATLAKIYVH